MCLVLFWGFPSCLLAEATSALSLHPLAGGAVPCVCGLVLVCSSGAHTHSQDPAALTLPVAMRTRMGRRRWLATWAGVTGGASGAVTFCSQT